MAKRTVVTIDGKDYYEDDIMPGGRPYADAVPVNAEDLEVGTMGGGTGTGPGPSWMTPPTVSTGNCPSHWPFLPQVGKSVTLVLPGTTYTSDQEVPVVFTKVDVHTEMLYFTHSSTIKNSILDRGQAKFSAINWNTGYQFKP